MTHDTIIFFATWQLIVLILLKANCLMTHNTFKPNLIFNIINKIWIVQFKVNTMLTHNIYENMLKR